MIVKPFQHSLVARLKPPIKALRIAEPSCRFRYGVCRMKHKVLSSAAKDFYQTLLSSLQGWTDQWEQIDPDSY